MRHRSHGCRRFIRLCRPARHALRAVTHAMAQVSSAADLRPAVVPLQAQIDIAPAASARWRFRRLRGRLRGHFRPLAVLSRRPAPRSVPAFDQRIPGSSAGGRTNVFKGLGELV